MLLEIEGVLEDHELATVRADIARETFHDGKRTAGPWAREAKNNQELDPGTAASRTLGEIVVGALYRSPRFRSAALPHKVSMPFFSRYGAGMAYGRHVDDPVMGEGPRYRSDIAITVFLSAPEDYDGGELVVHTTFGERAVKLPAGHGVIYPASSVHEVNEVTAGERLVAVAWAQSLVREAHKREILYDLDLARQALGQATPHAEVTTKVDRAYVNMVRMWADT